MQNEFSVILEEFETDLQSLETLTELDQGSGNPSKVRVASINSITLILAAAFEEFVRQMARKHAEQIVTNAKQVSDLPDALLENAWQRTLGDLKRNRLGQTSESERFAVAVRAARSKFEAVFQLLEGNTENIDQNFFMTVIHNERNMRAQEMTRLFKTCGMEQICLKICKRGSLMTYFKEDDENKIYSFFGRRLEDFFKRRNIIAHSLGTQSSHGGKTLIDDLEFFRALAQDLSNCLEGHWDRGAANAMTAEFTRVSR